MRAIVLALLLVSCTTLTPRDQAYIACDQFNSSVGRLAAIKATLPADAIKATDKAIAIVDPICKGVFVGTVDYAEAIRIVRNQLLITQAFVEEHTS